jgi:putative flippase GtrA
MREPARSRNPAERAVAALKKQVMVLKAISFAMIGVINATVNYVVFWLGLRALDEFPALGGRLKSVAAHCDCVSSENAAIIAANVGAWLVAVSGSYVMNSLVTFAAESGRKVTWRAYLTFAAFGLLGLLADTTALLIAKSFLPVMLAKLFGVGAGFFVNFSMSHFVVFRPRTATLSPRARGEGGEDR